MAQNTIKQNINTTGKDQRRINSQIIVTIETG